MWGGRGRISVGVLCVISCSGKPHLKPAFCFLNMDLIPSLMIYDKEDQCRLQVKVVCVSECVCGRAGGRAHTFVHILLCRHDCGCLCVFMRVCTFFNGYMLSNIAETGAAAGYVTPRRRERLRGEWRAGKPLEVNGRQVSLARLNQPSAGCSYWHCCKSR